MKMSVSYNNEGVTSYNRKVNIDGTYRPFHGYTAVSMAMDWRDLKEIEHYIHQSPVISKYFAALPVESYHMTVFNIWCHGNKLLPLQVNYLNELKVRLRKLCIQEHRRGTHTAIPTPSFDNAKREYLDSAKGEFSRGFVNQSQFLPLMTKVDKLCQSVNNFTAQVIASSSFHGLGVGLNLDEKTATEYNDLRTRIAPLVGHDDARLRPHMTFAYRYRDIAKKDEQKLQCALDKFNNFVQTKLQHGVRFATPRAVWFQNMTGYMTVEELYT